MVGVREVAKVEAARVGAMVGAEKVEATVEEVRAAVMVGAEKVAEKVAAAMAEG